MRSLSQGVLGHRSLGHSHPSQQLEDRRDFPHRDTHPVVQDVGGRHRPPSHSMGAGSVLIRRNLGVLTPHLPATGHAPAHLHPVLRHARLRDQWNVRSVGHVHSLMLEPSSTLRAGTPRHPHLHGWLGDLFWKRRFPVAKGALSGLAARGLGVGSPRPLGEGGCLALAAAPQVFDLLAQRFIDESQLLNLPLEPGNLLSETDDQRQEVRLAQG